MLLLVLGAFFPSNANAQSRCDQTRQRIYQITSTEAARISDSLRMVLDLAVFSRECEGEVSVERETWLLTAEVFALEGLEQYEEARLLIDRFFDAFFDEASSYYRARFFNWRLYLNMLLGDGVGMVVDYLEAEQYAGELDVVNQAHLHLNGAYAYREIKEYEDALKLVDKAKALLGQPATYEDSLALARALRDGAETQLRLGTQLQEAKEDLQDAARRYVSLGDTAQVATTKTLLGETYAAEGDTSFALVEMAAGVLLARQAGSVRNEIAALYRQGQLVRESGDLDAAEQSLMAALNVSETVQEFSSRVLYELAQLYEEKRDYKKATRYYQTIVDAPRPSHTFAAEVEAVRKAREGRNRVLLLRAERRMRRTLYGSAAILFLLLGLAGMGYVFRTRKLQENIARQEEEIARQEALLDQLEKAVVLPERLHTGLTLEQLEQCFHEIVKPKRKSLTLARRLARLFATLFDPDLVLPYLNDPYLAPQVEMDDIADNTALFLCVALVEKIVDGHVFRNDPANSLGSYLRGEFKRQGWPWPKNPLAWKLYFIRYHAKKLFKQMGS